MSILSDNNQRLESDMIQLKENNGELNQMMRMLDLSHTVANQRSNAIVEGLEDEVSGLEETFQSTVSVIAETADQEAQCLFFKRASAST